MSKYKPLSEHLAQLSGNEWRASLDAIEATLGFPLPKQARSGRAWWSNDGEKPHSRAWIGLGWRVEDVDHAAGVVSFRRAAAQAVQPSALKAAAEKASQRMHQQRAAGMAAIVAGAVAVAAGLGALAAKTLKRKG